MYGELERRLDQLGATDQGKAFFLWVAMYPVGIEHGTIWDEHRRGAIICLAKYAYNKETELILARHLDDWVMIQMEAARLLADFKSRILPKIAYWYMERDSLFKEALEDYL